MNWLMHRIQALKSDLKGWRTPGSFVRNALFTSADAAVTILLQLVFTPILARLYSPEAYGVFGLFNSIASNLSNVANLGYPLAYSLPKDEDRFHALVRVGWWLLWAVVLLSLPFFLLPSLLYTLIPSWSVMGQWCIAIPVLVAAVGLAQMLIGMYGRVKAFGTFARTNMFTNLTLRLSSTGLGLLASPLLPGLIVSEVVVRCGVLIQYVRDLGKHGVARFWRSVPVERMKVVALEYKEYPLYIFPSRWLNLLALQLPIYGLIAMKQDNATGQFTMAGALLLMPLRMFGYSLYGVFLRRAIDAGREKPQELADITRRMYQRLMFIGVVPMMVITFFADVVLNFVLGPKWGMAGALTALLGPFYFFRLLAEPLSAVFVALRSERSLFVFNLIVVLTCGAAIGWSVFTAANPYVLVSLFSSVNTVVYACLSAYILHTVGLPWLNMTARTLLVMIAAAAVCALSRWLLIGSIAPGY